MSVTLVFESFHEDVLKQWVDDQENFHKKDHPDCESIALGVELMAVADLAGRAKDKEKDCPDAKFLFDMIMGVGGDPVYDDGNYPMVGSAEDVAKAARLMDTITDDELRSGFDIEALKKAYLEMDGLWELLGPNILEEHLIPMFHKIRDFFQRAAGRKQKVVVSWF